MLLPFNLRSFPLFQPTRLLCQLIIGHDPSGLNMILSQPIHESKLDQQLTQPGDDVPPRLCSQGYVEALRVSVGRRTRRTNDLSSPQASRKQRFNLQRVTLTWWWALPKSYVLHRYIIYIYMCNVHISRWINYLIYTLGIDLWRDCNNISTYNEII